VRAAHLCKADLATQMVVEMTSLQGVMGSYYALDSGEPPEVARAILEHYQPRGADDFAPETPPGMAVAIADRLDSLAGLFTAGLAPTGTRDPFALRRAALGLIQIILDRNIPLDLREAVHLAAALQPIPVSDAVKAQVLEFLAGRLRGVLAEKGFRYDVIEAVLAEQAHLPLLALGAVKELADFVAMPEWPQILAAYARCVRITRDLQERYSVNEETIVLEEEKALWNTAKALQRYADDQRNKGALTVKGILEAFLPHVGTVSAFFDKVLVMAEDPSIRANRLGMLQAIVDLPKGVADFSKLEGF
jgi:glycyl-tRNA synthetase